MLEYSQEVVVKKVNILDMITKNEYTGEHADMNPTFCQNNYRSVDLALIMNTAI